MTYRYTLALSLLAALLSLLFSQRASAVLLFDGGAGEGNVNAIEVTIRVLANDFEFPERSTVESAEVWAMTDANWDGTIEYFFFEDVGNTPADTPLVSGDGMNIVPTPTGVTSGGLTESVFAFDLEAPLILQAGQKYWFGLHMKQSFVDDGNYAFWSTTSLDFGETSRSAEGGNFAAWGIPPDDEGFRLYGVVPEPAAVLQALAGVLALVGWRGVRVAAR